MSDARRILVLWNASSGRKAGLPTNTISADSLRELLTRFGLGDELVETTSEEDAIARTRKAVAEGYDVVVAAGGDGSIGLVAQELLDTETALGILPLGSIMNIPRMLGIPRDREDAADVLRAGATRRIDVGMAEGRPFYEVASIGFHAAIFAEMAAVDQGDRGAIWRSIAAAFRYRPSRMTIELDDDPSRTIRTRALLVAVANGRYMGAGFTVAPDARLDDGRFDVRIFRNYSKRMLLRHGVSIAFGRHAYAPHVDTEHAALVRITGASTLPARVDARELGGTPVELRVRPHALLVVAPPDETGDR